MAGHTPGPWTAARYSSVVGLPVTAQPDPSENTVVICGVRGERDVAEANARLIASAPELLSIVMRFVALPSGAWHPERNAHDEAELMQDARAAIAKATGA